MAFADLLPAGVVVVGGVVSDPRWAALVPPEERALVAGRPAVRRADFVAGRACARLALERLGEAAPRVVGRRPDGSPQWPPGVVGSITHGGGEVAAAVAPAGVLRGVGIDAEAAVALDPGTARVVATEAERASASACGLGPLGPGVVFSLKEAVLKAWAPTVGPLEPEDVRVDLGRDGSATATVLATGVRLGGAWEVAGDVVRAAAWRLASG